MFTIDANEFQVHNLTEDILTDEEKDALAYGINFIPKPKADRTKVDDAYEEFARLARIKMHFAQDLSSQESEQSSPSPFYLKTGWNVPPRLHDPQLEKALKLLKEDLSTVQQRNYSRNWNGNKNEALKTLLSKPDRLVITADKNLGYCYVTCDWYREKALEHLHDKATYLNVSRTVLKDDEGAGTISNIFGRL